MSTITNIYLRNIDSVRLPIQYLHFLPPKASCIHMHTYAVNSYSKQENLYILNKTIYRKLILKDNSESISIVEFCSL